MRSDLCIDFDVEISFLHLKLTPGVGNLCVRCVLRVHSCLFTLSFLTATTDMTELAVLLCNLIYHHKHHTVNRYYVLHAFNISTRLGLLVRNTAVLVGRPSWWHQCFGSHTNPGHPGSQSIALNTEARLLRCHTPAIYTIHTVSQGRKAVMGKS